MKTKLFLSIASIVVAAGLSGCALVPSQLGYAVVVAEKEPITATEVIPNKQGQACGFNLLGIVALGDASIDKAKFDGRIRRVATVDKSIFSILGMFSSVCITVTGE